jgi:membrane protein
MATLWNIGGLTWRELGRCIWDELSEDSILGWSAQLSFYFLLSMFPTLFFLLVLLGYFVG